MMSSLFIKTTNHFQAKNVAVLALDSYASVQKTFVKTREYLGEILSAFEFIDQAGHSIQQSHALSPRKILENGEDAPFFVLIETTGSNKDHDDEVLLLFWLVIYVFNLALRNSQHFWRIC